MSVSPRRARRSQFRMVYVPVAVVAACGVIGLVLMSAVPHFLSPIPPPLVVSFFFLLIVAAVMIMPMIALANSMMGMSDRSRQLSLRQFALRNGFRYQPRPRALKLAGTLFRRGSELGSVELFYDILTAQSDRRVIIGNYRTGATAYDATRWGFLALGLDRSIPHLLLVSRERGSVLEARLPSSYDRKQLFELEGDFNSYFRLFCPKGAERDALYVLTPDVMAALVDNVAQNDVEIVGDTLFVYSKEPIDVLDEAKWAGAARIIATVGKQTVDQTRRFTPEMPRSTDRALAADRLRVTTRSRLFTSIGKNQTAVAMALLFGVPALIIGSVGVQLFFEAISRGH